jgi:DNA primase
MPGIDYAAVRRAIPMSRVLELLDYQAVIRRGVRLRGWCPLTATCSPESFRVELAKNVFHCFSCGAGGNQLDLWSAFHRLELLPAAEHLCHAAGIAVPSLDQSDATRNRRTG